MAAIASASALLEYSFGLPEEARRVDTALEKCLAKLESSRSIWMDARARIMSMVDGDEKADFMQRALYTPALGYYSAPRNRFGARGDFVTAPEISPRFAVCVARQIAQVFDMLDAPAGGGNVLEVGAGSGVLAEGVLDALSASGRGDVEYFILERSAGGRGFQQQRLARFGDRVRWLDELPRSGFAGVILANELLDAIPARCFQVHQGAAVELGVAAADGGFQLVQRAFAL